MNLFGEDDSGPIKNKTGSFINNPCIPVYGAGPESVKCKTCVHLVTKRYSKTYYKCALRKDTNGPATDHRVNWPACGKYEKDNNYKTT